MAYARRKRRNPPPLGLFIVAPFALFGVLWVASQFNPEFKNNSAMLDTIAQNQASAEMESAFAEAEMTRAKSRYTSGICVKVPNGLVEGQYFPDLTAGSQVCTVDGVTGRIDRNGYVEDLARTNDQAVIVQWRGF